MNIQTIKNNLNSKKAEKKLLLENIENKETKLKKSKRSLTNAEEAKTIIQITAQEVQKNVEYRISEIVSYALAAVFEEPYEFVLEFVLKRGKTEADLYYTRNGNRYDPMDSSSGGVADLASFALRIALWNISKKKLNNTIVLDEPFKHLSKEYPEKASEMLKALSEKLNLQFIIFSHNDKLIEGSDKVWQIKLKNRVSEVVEI